VSELARSEARQREGHKGQGRTCREDMRNLHVARAEAVLIKRGHIGTGQPAGHAIVGADLRHERLERALVAINVTPLASPLHQSATSGLARALLARLSAVARAFCASVSGRRCCGSPVKHVARCLRIDRFDP
jgi:hypothetical protein